MRKLSDSGVPIMEVYGISGPTAKHADPYWINEADFDPKLHRDADEGPPKAKGAQKPAEGAGAQKPPEGNK